MNLLNKRFITILYVLCDIIAVTVASLVAVVASRAVNTIEIGYVMYFYALASNAIITVAVFLLLKMYSNLDIYVGAFEGLKLILGCIIITVLHFVEMQFILKMIDTVDLAYILIFFLLTIALTMIPRYFRRAVAAIKGYVLNYINGDRTPVMIIGAGDAGVSLLREIERSDRISYAVKCFVDDDPKKIGTYIDGVKVEGNRDAVPELVWIK